MDTPRSTHTCNKRSMGPWQHVSAFGHRCPTGAGPLSPIAGWPSCVYLAKMPFKVSRSQGCLNHARRRARTLRAKMCAMGSTSLGMATARANSTARTGAALPSTTVAIFVRRCLSACDEAGVASTP
eukprot:1003938-Alexandrium_andersonii.AAC.1